VLFRSLVLSPLRVVFSRRLLGSVGVRVTESSEGGEGESVREIEFTNGDRFEEYRVGGHVCC